MNSELRYIPSGDSAFIVKAGDGISEEVNLTVRTLLACLESRKITGITDFIPSYNELLICYDPCVIGYRKLLGMLHSIEEETEKTELPFNALVEVPVLYGGVWGPDLPEVAATNGLTEREVIEIHTSVDYLVYMLGFTPGFCYLGGMDERIATPRKKVPRMEIPAGAVGIADRQTGIYPVESPGGWQLIGQTPLQLFCPDREPVFLFNPGDLIRFSPIGEHEYKRIEEAVKRGTYSVQKQQIKR